MAVIETWLHQDLQEPVKVNHLDGNLFSNNGNGNRIGVVLTNNGEDLASISGTVSGYVVTSDGSTVPCTGSKSGNRASILIPAAAYQPGSIFITVFVTDGTTVTTIGAVSTTVMRSRTNAQVDPGSAVTDWTQTINAAMQSVETAAANLGGIVAVPYASITFPVPLGKYTYYNNNLYRCITPIASSESFTAAHWTQVRLGDDVSDLKSAIASELTEETENIFIFPRLDDRNLRDGTLFTHYPNNSTIEISTTQSLASDYLIYRFVNLEANKTYVCRIIESEGSSVNYELWRHNSSTGAQTALLTDGLEFTPAADNYLCLTFKSGYQQNGTIMFYIAEKSKSNKYIVPNISATDYIARRTINEERYEQDVIDDGIRKEIDIISEESENVFVFPRLDDRELRSGTLFTHYPNNSSIQIRTTQSLASDYLIDRFVNLEANKTYVCRIIESEGSSVNYELWRHNSSTGAQTALLTNGLEFTPAADNFLRLTFKSGYGQNGTLMFYVAEKTKDSGFFVPNIDATDYKARGNADRVPVEKSDNLFYFNNTASRTIGELTCSFPNKSTISVSTGETPLSEKHTISGLMGDNVLEAGKTYCFTRKVIESGLSYIVRRIDASTSDEIESLSVNTIFTPAVDEKLVLDFLGGYTQNGTILFYIAERETIPDARMPYKDYTAVDLVERGITEKENIIYTWGKRAQRVRDIAFYQGVYFLPFNAIGMSMNRGNGLHGDEYVLDNIHPTSLGGFNVAMGVWSYLKKIPLWYTSIPGTVVDYNNGEQWAGKKWYAYGTSLTTNQYGKYAETVAQLSGMELHNKARGGRGLATLPFSESIAEALLDPTDGKLEADLITIEVGANDTCPIGVVNSYSTFIQNTGWVNPTFCGALNYCIKQLFMMGVQAQIVLMPSYPSRYRGTAEDPIYNDIDTTYYYGW